LKIQKNNPSEKNDQFIGQMNFGSKLTSEILIFGLKIRFLIFTQNSADQHIGHFSRVG